MDSKLQELLDQIPERAPRSKLEPHAEVIRELRKKRRTYQEIAAFFRAHLHLSVAPSTIHEFVKTRARQARNRMREQEELPPAPAREKGRESRSFAAENDASSPTDSPVRERIRAVKNQSVVSEKAAPRFEFDPQSPLTLKPKPKEK